MNNHESGMRASGSRQRPDDRVVREAFNYPRDADWPTLMARMVYDLSRIIQMELRLFEANSAQLLRGIVDQALGGLVLVGAVMTGGLCLLVALIMLLHTWFLWWESFAITGALLLSI